MRGVKFTEDALWATVLGVDAVIVQNWNIAHQALSEVARWLGYKSDEDYNDATIKRPREVRRRLKEAK